MVPLQVPAWDWGPLLPSFLSLVVLVSSVQLEGQTQGQDVNYKLCNLIDSSFELNVLISVFKTGIAR